MRKSFRRWSRKLLVGGTLVVFTIIVLNSFLPISELVLSPLVSRVSPPLEEIRLTPRMAEAVVSAAEASFLKDDELVIGTVVAGQARAYPIGYLQHGEHINDQIGDQPVLASW